MGKLVAIIERITYHSEETGWSVLRVNPISRSHETQTVTAHGAHFYAGATMEFTGEWTTHKQYGNQFKATGFIEQKPASASALQKYLGSGLIYGVGPKIAKRIVDYFGDSTLDVFESDIDRLEAVPGIANRKLEQIRSSWEEHREIRNVMVFLQEYGVSTLFAVKIYKTYGNDAIAIVKSNPYQLARDIYGIGFLSSDRIALSMGISENSMQRITAAILHLLASIRDQGHCYLEIENIIKGVNDLLKNNYTELIERAISEMESSGDIKVRLNNKADYSEKCYYSKSLYFDEKEVSERLSSFLSETIRVDKKRVESWLIRYNTKQEYPLSEDQFNSVKGIVCQSVSILTGGPGCGKTTTTKALVRLLEAMGKVVLLSAPTGRASQRMSEVIGKEAVTLHRLLDYQPQTGDFAKNDESPLEADYIIIDECSMLDITLMSRLMRACSLSTQLLFIGDPNQLPSVGAGNVLKDMIDSNAVPVFELSKVFRQAEESLIIKYAHQINQGMIPRMDSPLRSANVWDEGIDCLFIDSEESTKDQLRFIEKVKVKMQSVLNESGEVYYRNTSGDHYRLNNEEDYFVESITEEELLDLRTHGVGKYLFSVPRAFENVGIDDLLKVEDHALALKELLGSIHPWSSLHYGFTASEMIVRLYTRTLKKRFGSIGEIQILSPMSVGSLGSRNLNTLIQSAIHTGSEEEQMVQIGDRCFRINDRVIQRRNNYDLEVFNGDIGRVEHLDSQKSVLHVRYVSSISNRLVEYSKQDILDLDLGYAITIHKSQGSEFDVVIIPILMQHFTMLYRNLIYTALTRAKKLVIFVGSRKSLGIATRNVDNRARKTMLCSLLREDMG